MKTSLEVFFVMLAIGVWLDTLVPMDFEDHITTRFSKIAADATEPLPLSTFTDGMDAELFVNWCLSGSYNDDGIERWWGRPRTHLEGLSPSQAWQEQPERVIGLAGWLVNKSLEPSQDSH